MCDKERQCPLGDDEDYCHFSCPDMCSCQALNVQCKGTFIQQVPISVDKKARMLDLSHNNISILSIHSLDFPFMAKLFLSHNALASIPPDTFSLMRNLLMLDLGFNDLTELRAGTFEGLTSLKRLYLLGNSGIKYIQFGTFRSLVNIPNLVMTEMKIQRIDDLTFKGLENVKTINLSNNEIQSISNGAFEGLSMLTSLELEGNDIRVIYKASFLPMERLESLRSDHFKLCCMAVQVERANCYPPQDPISSCEDLMNNNWLRAFIWILGLMAFLGNIFVMIWRLSLQSASISDIFITNLALSDFQMGLYLLIIAGVDFYYHGVFIEYSDIWRESWLCQFSGFLATFSSESSVMFLVALTVDRFINIIFPFSGMVFSRAGAKKLSLFIWFFGCLVSITPFIPIDYFGGTYYGRSGVCMALPITNEKPPG